jgi:ribosome biogenesis GTPase / thiamine phosphate phosphatase
MAKKSKKKNQQLDDLSERERVEIYSRAAKLRKAAVNKPEKSNWKRKVREGDYDHVYSSERRTGTQEKSIDKWAQKALSKAGEMGIFEGESTDENFHKGLIRALSRQGGSLIHKGVDYDFMVKPEMLLMQKTELAVGERVLFSFDKENHCLVEQPLERTQILSRPDPTRPEVERVIAVNMDAIIIVAALENPSLNFGLIDRFLIGIAQSGAEPIICINKLDLLNDNNRQSFESVEIYRKLGIKVFACSASSQEGIDEMVNYLGEKICVFLGTSGVGKSSLLNAIDPELNIKTSANREKAAGRGRHTTVMAELHQVKGGMKIIDTPGVREFNFVDLSESEVQYGFQEFIEHLPCRFNNCIHDQEAGCNIKAAVESGSITEFRYESYLKILKTLDVKRLAQKPRDNLLL